ncbi:serine/threonine protein kinase [Minicystis rosea]|nr:serine/threonine protein kinase [Minicystis rosea]
MSADPPYVPRSIGRYVMHEPIAAGGMATVHLGRMHGAAGFAVTVAIKRLLPEHAGVRRFVEMFLDEARIAARVRHPNVVPVFDLVIEDEEVFLVMDYVHGVTLAELLRKAREQGQTLPPRVATSIVCDALEGLHAAHRATGEEGNPLGLVHRDVSPQNILVGADGVARVLDFGVARAAGRVQASTDGALKGKIQYMAPEQLAANLTSPASDIYSTAIVLWEALTGQRPFTGATEIELVGHKLADEIAPPSRFVPGLPPALDAVVRRATATIPEARFATAREMCVALEQALPGATAEVSTWTQHLAAADLAARAALVARVERMRPEPSLAAVPRAEAHPAAEADVWKQLGARSRPRGTR